MDSCPAIRVSSTGPDYSPSMRNPHATTVDDCERASRETDVPNQTSENIWPHVFIGSEIIVRESALRVTYRHRYNAVAC